MNALFFRLLPLIAFVCLTACTPQQRSADHYFPLLLDGTTIHLQLALDDSERAQGLMFRESLDDDHGMLFLFERPAGRSFWMRNTRIPLDLAYFDATGRLLEIHPLYPYDETGVPSRSRNVLIAIEMTQGWFSKNKVRPGAQLDLTALKAAVAARGKDPAKYALKENER